MILRGILRSIMFIIDGIAKIAAWLLGALGLWLPALFSFVFFISCAINNIKIEGNTLAFFWIGCVLSFVGSVLISLNRINKEKRRKSEVETARNVEKIKKKGEANTKLVTYDEDDDIFKASDEENLAPTKEVSDEIREVIERTPQKPVPRIYQEMPRENNVDEKKTAEKKVAEKNGVDSFIPYNKQDVGVDIATEFADTKTTLVATETPKVFKVKYDPTIVVHEYENRLEFFKRTRQGLVLMQTKMK